MQSHTKRRPSKSRSKGPRPEARAYQLVVRWSQEDQAFLVRAPALTGCITHGATLEEALRSGLEAVELWLDEAIEHGDPIPPTRPALSGKMTIRMPPSLHERVAEAAERDGVSLNQWVVSRLWRGIDA
ncbi:MAG: toxin-antitoxin system HicB family antitoxin [Deltaproteobacteria bacterium]|nr:toxin-antitoxin system HicB family antitoxin [Deltaproteobacteria bacterium]